MEEKIDLNVDKWAELNKELNPKAIMLYVYFLSLDKPFRLNKLNICKIFNLSDKIYYAAIKQLKSKNYLKEVAKNEYVIDNDLFEPNCAREESISDKIGIPEDICEEALQELEKAYDESLISINNRTNKILMETILNERQKNPENLDNIIMKTLRTNMFGRLDRDSIVSKELDPFDACKKYVECKYQRKDVDFLYDPKYDYR